MNDPVHMMLLVLGFFATMSALLYVLARIDPQTDPDGAGAGAVTMHSRHS